MNTFLSTFAADAASVHSTPEKLLVEVGHSKANWFNWKKGNYKPSDVIKNKLIKRIEEKRAELAPKQVKQVWGDPQTLLEQKKIELKRTQQAITALEILIENL